MRLLVLHARGRWAGQIACALAGVSSASAAIVVFADDTGMLVPVLGPLTAASLLAFALCGADPALERITPRPWARWRLCELAVCAVAGALVVLPAVLVEGGQAEALRNLAGLGGIAALGAVVLGARLAWLSPTAWVLGAAAIGPRPDEPYAPLVWIIRSGGASWALAFAVAGALAFARFGTASTAMR